MYLAQTSFRTRRWLIAGLILPALLLRTAIPAGLMPVFDAQRGLVIEFCPGVAGAGHDSQSPVHEHHHAHHGGTDAHGKTAGSHGDVCPFALSAGPALASAVDVDMGLTHVAVHVVSEAPATRAVANIERAQSARGPPLANWI